MKNALPDVEGFEKNEKLDIAMRPEEVRKPKQLCCQGRLLLLKWYCDENHIFPIEPILKHKQVACMTRKVLFTILKYLFSLKYAN